MVDTVSKFPQAYSLTGTQIPAAKFQLQTRREQERPRTRLTPVDMCTQVNWPRSKRKADGKKNKTTKKDRLKQFQRETIQCSNSRASVSTKVTHSLFCWEKLRKFYSNQLKTKMFEIVTQRNEPDLPLISRSSGRLASSYLRLIVSKTVLFFLSYRENIQRATETAKKKKKVSQENRAGTARTAGWKVRSRLESGWRARPKRC